MSRQGGAGAHATVSLARLAVWQSGWTAVGLLGTVDNWCPVPGQTDDNYVDEVGLAGLPGRKRRD